MTELSRRGFLAGLLGTAVVTLSPGSAFAETVSAPEGWKYQWIRSALFGDESFSEVPEFLNRGWSLVAPAEIPNAPSEPLGVAMRTDGLVLVKKPKET